MQNETDKYYVQHLHSAGNMQERLALQETCKPRQICKNLQRFVFSVSFGIDVQHLHSAGNMQERLARKFHLFHTRNKETVANLGWFSEIWFSNYGSEERLWRVLAALPETAAGPQARVACHI